MRDTAGETVQVFGDAALQQENLTPRRKGAKRRSKKKKTLRPHSLRLGAFA
jgi:hypothetical protein